MAYINDAAYDAGLNWIITNGTVFHLCSAEPANFAGIAAVELASEAVVLTAPEDGDASGRKTTIPAITGDDVDTSGTATHWAISNGTDTLVATGSTTAGVAVDASGTYNFGGTNITFPDAT